MLLDPLHPGLLARTHDEIFIHTMPVILGRWQYENPSRYPANPFDPNEPKRMEKERMSFWREMSQDKGTFLEFYYTYRHVLDVERVSLLPYAQGSPRLGPMLTILLLSDLLRACTGRSENPYMGMPLCGQGC